MNTQTPLTLAIVGAGGFGLRHLEVAETLESEGRVELVAVVEPDPARGGERLARVVDRGVTLHRSFETFLNAAPFPAVVSIVTPPHRHAEQARTVCEADGAVWLEKPPTTTIPDFNMLEICVAERGSLVQVDFMWHACSTTLVASEVLQSGRLGRVLAVTATAAGPRPDSYYARNTWAGQERLEDSTAVHDGPLTNAFAHVLDMALHLAAGAQPQRAAEPIAVRAERYCARPLTGDDFVCLDATIEDDVRLVVAVAHCVRREIPVRIRVECEGGELTWSPTGPVTVRYGAGARGRRIAPPAVDVHAAMLRNLCAAVGGRGGSPTGSNDSHLTWPLAATRPWMHLTSLVRASCPSPLRIPPEAVRIVGEDRVYAVRGMQSIYRRLRETGELPSDQGIPWAARTESVGFSTLAETLGADGEAAVPPRYDPRRPSP